MLKHIQRLFDRPKPAAPPPRELVMRSLERIRQLPTLSDTAMRAMSLANDFNCDMAEYVALIQRDASLTAAVLKLANSVLYGSGGPTTNLKQAIVRIGLGSCSSLAASVGMRGVVRCANEQTQQTCELLLRHGAFVACLATTFNQALKLEFKGEEFTASLLHDLGRLILALAAPELFTQADSLDFDETGEVLAQEQFVLGTDHCQIGYEYGGRNSLPEPILHAIRDHHHPERARTDARLVRLIAAMDHLANHIHREHKVTNYSLRLNPGFVLLSLGWGQEKRHFAEQQLPQIVKRALRMTRAMLKAQA